MADLISLSSGSEDDSDIEFVSSYRDNSSNGIPFITAELLPVTPVLIDITDRHFSSDGPRPPQKLKKLSCSTIEIIDLSNVPESRVSFTGKSHGTVHQLSYTVNLEKDVICRDSDDMDVGASPIPVSCDRENSYTDQHDVVHSHLQDSSTQRSVNVPHHSLLTFEPSNGLPEIYQPQNTNYMQHTSTSPPAVTTSDHNERCDSPTSWLNRALSPFSLDSPYYCPSEIDAVVFSDESLILYDDVADQQHTTSSLDKTVLKVDESMDVYGTTPMHMHTPSPYPQTRSQLTPQTLPTSDQAPLPVSPTSTELLAGDSSETGSDLVMESPPVSPVKSLHPLSPSLDLMFGIKDSVTASEANVSCTSSNSADPSEHDGQQISLAQFRKMKHLLGGRVQDMHTADEHDDFGMAEPLCRQSLSLVYSTIEENYTEGTLQLLSDLIQPCYYPPADITAHLLKGILLRPQCPRVLAVEAYNLLMRTQKYRAADRSTIPWDWQLISSMMTEQDEARRQHSEVRCLLLQYVLQILEDDFQFKLPMLRLHLSIANEMLSCDRRFTQVRELVSWLLDAAKQSFCTSQDDGKQKRERNFCLKMLLILQKMLLLAMEVDLRPTCSSIKLSEELCNSLNSVAPCRRLRFLLLSTLQSNLLRCKMVEQLLDQSCCQKRGLPMSFKLLLHFLQTSTLAPDPSDGTERWRRWDELLRLVWMFMLSYQEVITGHLHLSITERFKLNRAPMWTLNDQVSRAAVQEAAEAFLSRAVEDLGHDLPSQIQESLSQLQEHLLSISVQ